jgi:hypothetical protein
VLDTRAHRALLNRLMDAEAHAGRVMTGDARPAAGAKVGALRVLDGCADQSEYTLHAHTSLIGKGNSLVRLKGWFKPSLAVAITRNRLGYVATLVGGKARINNQPLRERCELKEGDVLDVGGLSLEFRLIDAAANASSECTQPPPRVADTSAAGSAQAQAS